METKPKIGSAILYGLAHRIANLSYTAAVA